VRSEPQFEVLRRRRSAGLPWRLHGYPLARLRIRVRVRVRVMYPCGPIDGQNGTNKHHLASGYMYRDHDRS